MTLSSQRSVAARKTTRDDPAGPAIIARAPRAPTDLMPVVMFSTFWVPTAFMPGWYEDIASRNPFTSLVDAGRSVLLGAADWGSIRVSLAVLAILGAGTYFLGDQEVHRNGEG